MFEKDFFTRKQLYKIITQQTNNNINFNWNIWQGALNKYFWSLVVFDRGLFLSRVEFDRDFSSGYCIYQSMYSQLISSR